MNILVIGGSGFIGTRLVDELLQAGHQVRIYDIQKSQKYPDLSAEGDVRSAVQLQKAAEGIEVIYNLAAEHSDDVIPISLYHEVNVKGAENVIHAAVANGIKHIIFTSTVAIYGLDKNCPDENFSVAPFNEYGRTKWEAEKLFLRWASEDSANSLGVIRPAVIFGEGNRGNVYSLIAQIKSGQFIMIGNGHNKKSMGYVGNIASFLLEMAEKKGIAIFNFCDKPDLSSLEIATIIAEELGTKLPSIKFPLWVGLIAGNVFDLVSRITGAKIRISVIRIRKFAAETTISTERLSDTGYKPKYSIEDGIRLMIQNDFK